MFYKLIEKTRNEWLSSPSCVDSDLISYIERQHKMRYAQIESIKTYLYLKIECGNKPLWELVASGKFNSIDIVDRQELGNFIKDNNDTVIEIELRDLKELLDNAILQDEVEYTLSEDPSMMVDIFTVVIKRFFSDSVSYKINEFNQKAMANSKKKFTPIEMSLKGLEAIEMISLDCTTAEQNAPWHSDSEIKIEKDSTVTISGRKTTDFWDDTIHADTKPLRMKIRNICGETITILNL